MASFDDMLKSIDELEGQLSAKTAPEEKRMSALAKKSEEASTDLTKSIGDFETRIKAARPPATQLPTRPKMGQGEPMDALGNPLAIAAIFGSFLTRAPLTTALRAAGGAMKGYQEGRLSAAKEAHQQYEDALQEALKQHEIEVENYRDLMDEFGSTMRGKAAVLESISKAFGMEHISAALAQGRTDQAVAMWNGYTQHMDRAKDRTFMHDLQTRAETRAENAQTEIERHNREMEKVQHERNTLITGKGTAKVEEQVQALTGLKDDVSELRGMVDNDPSLVGTKGLFRRGMQAVVGQTSEDQEHDKAAQDFKARVHSLQVRLIPIIKARNFSGPVQKALEQLVPGLEKFDDPQTVKSSLEELERVLDRDIATRKQVTGQVNQNLKDLSNEDLLRQLGLQ